MKYLNVFAAAIRVCLWLIACLPFAVTAEPITLTELSGSSDGGYVGGYTMTQFNPITGTMQDCLNTPIDDNVQMCFEEEDGDALSMVVTNAFEDGWWEYDHGNVLGTHVNWIELILPENTRALSFWVGAVGPGIAWIEAFDAYDTSTHSGTFRIGPDKTVGYSVAVTDSCNSISRVVVDPVWWAIGNFSINQDPCVSVPEPSSHILFFIALLALGFLGRRRRFASAKS